jgi:Ca2+-binding EF-hand superfamily protein
MPVSMTDIPIPRARHTLLLSLGILLVSGCSSSHHRGENKESHENTAKAIIQMMDLNGDNQVSWQENQRYFEKLFDRLDVNHDGYISEEEFQAITNDPIFKAMPLQKLQVSFTMFDRNDDHKLSRDEFEHMGDRLFTLLDRNMDGIISESDFNESNDSPSHDSSSGGRSGGRGRGGNAGGNGGI